MTIAPVAHAAGLGFIPFAEEHYDFALVTAQKDQPGGAGVPARAGIGGKPFGAGAGRVSAGVGVTPGSSSRLVLASACLFRATLKKSAPIQRRETFRLRNVIHGVGVEEGSSGVVGQVTVASL